MNWIDFIEAWAGCLAVAAFVDQLASKDFKKDIANFLLKKLSSKSSDDNIKSFSQLGSLYIQNTLISFFGENPVTSKAFLRSMLLSVICIILLFLVSILQDPKPFNESFKPTIDALTYYPMWLFGSGIFLLFIDYLSFVQTFLLMRYARNAISVANVIFLAYCDIVLSVGLLIFLLPIRTTIYTIGMFRAPYQAIFNLILEDPPLILKQSNIPFEKEDKHLDLLDQSNDQLGHAASYNLLVKEAGPARPYILTSKDFALNLNTYRVIAIRFNGLSSEQANLQLAQILPHIVGFEGSSLHPEFDIQIPLIKTSLKQITLQQPFHSNTAISELLNVKALSQLYSLGFLYAQEIQYRLPEFLWSPPDQRGLGDTYLAYANILLNDHSKKVKRLSKDHINLSQLVHIKICDGKAVDWNSMEKCLQKILIEYDLQTIQSETHLAALRTSSLPVLSLVCSSLCVTIIFYISLLFFLVCGACFRGLPYRLRNVARSHVDLEIVERAPIMIVLGSRIFTTHHTFDPLLNLWEVPLPNR